ncbi:MAG: DUF4097 family beta strand repeat-containing protein [Acidobacteriota bacterium]
MRMKALIIGVVLLISSLGLASQEVKTLTLPAERILKLEISCGAGFLTVRGVEGLKAFEVKAEIYARGVDSDEMAEFIEDHIRLSLKEKGSTAVLVSEVEHDSFFFSRDARIDVTVRVPLNMNLDIDDGSGSIDIENINGDVYIEDGSGELHVENIQGNLEIDDGSGELEVRGVTGNVEIDDGSGSITVSDVGGSVTVGDGSGSIDVDGVGKDLTLKETGSGGLHFRNVKGRVVK